MTALFDCPARYLFVSFQDEIHFTGWGVGIRNAAKEKKSVTIPQAKPV
jgi:hypothetical protein